MRRCLCKCVQSFFVIYSFLFLEVSLYATDVVVVLDTSGSLLTHYDEITGVVLEEIFTKHVKKHDLFHLISFDTYPRVEIAKKVESEEDFSSIVSKFLLSYPLAKDSDFLLMLDFLKEYISSFPTSHNKKLIFISDGFFYSTRSPNYTQNDFKIKVDDFSTYLLNSKNIKTYYIKLPIFSNQIMLDLNNNLSYFIRIHSDAIYQPTYNLPLSLKQYLYFDEVRSRFLKNKHNDLYTSDIFLDSNLERVETRRINNTVKKRSEITGDGKLENLLAGEFETAIIVTDKSIEHETFKNFDDSFSIRKKELMIKNDFKSLSKSKTTSIIEEKRLYIPKIYIISGVLLLLVIFFVIKKYIRKYNSIFIEKTSIENKMNSDIFFIKKDKLRKKGSNNEILFSLKEERLQTIGKGKKLLSELLKIFTKSFFKTLSKTMEDRFATKYSPTFVKLSTNTKEVFRRGGDIENMLSILEAPYTNTGDVFYRFKHSLYTKKYINNVDVTNKNFLEIFVVNQKRSIGMRNVHLISLNKTFYIGGGKKDDFLIFLVPLPHKLASIHYNGKEIIFKILKPNYFPYETELEIKNPIDRFFVIVTEKNYSIYFIFRIYEKETTYSSKIISH